MAIVPTSELTILRETCRALIQQCDEALETAAIEMERPVDGGP